MMKKRKPDFEKDQLIGGKYTLKKYLGGGQDGEVWLAIAKSSGKKIAIKFLNSIEQDDKKARFYKEIKILSEINHSNIINIYVTNHDEAWNPKSRKYVPYYVMEYYEVLQLNDYIKQVPRDEILKTFCNIFQQIASALDEIHSKNITHGDIKSSNVLVITKERVGKLTDFGFGSFHGEDKTERDEYTKSSYKTPIIYTPREADIYKLGRTFKDCKGILESKLHYIESLYIEEVIMELIERPDKVKLEDVCSRLENIKELSYRIGKIYFEVEEYMKEWVIEKQHFERIFLYVEISKTQSLNFRERKNKEFLDNFKNTVYLRLALEDLVKELGGEIGYKSDCLFMCLFENPEDAITAAFKLLIKIEINKKFLNEKKKNIKPYVVRIGIHKVMVLKCANRWEEQFLDNSYPFSRFKERKHLFTKDEIMKEDILLNQSIANIAGPYHVYVSENVISMLNVKWVHKDKNEKKWGEVEIYKNSYLVEYKKDISKFSLNGTFNPHSLAIYRIEITEISVYELYCSYLLKEKEGNINDFKKRLNQNLGLQILKIQREFDKFKTFFQKPHTFDSIEIKKIEVHAEDLLKVLKTLGFKIRISKSHTIAEYWLGDTLAVWASISNRKGALPHIVKNLIRN